MAGGVEVYVGLDGVGLGGEEGGEKGGGGGGGGRN